MDASNLPAEIHVLPSKAALQHARSKLLDTLPEEGLGPTPIQKHIANDLVPAFSRANKSPHYYGFVTGGATSAAIIADHIVVDVDQNLHNHLPNDTVATDVEDAALKLLCQLLQLNADQWPHRIFSTGATASNVLGLACGREFAVQRAVANTHGAGNGTDGEIGLSVGEYGIYEAMRMAGLEEIQILTTVPHSSLRKAASIVGLGRASMKDIGRKDLPHKFDFEALERALAKPRTASIVAVSCGEVNTGLFATTGEEMKQLRGLCDRYGAWLHVDAAFGLLARVLPKTKEFETILQGVEGLELADSITGDAHKLLNVPYDCGIFLSRHLTIGLDVFKNTNAAYLTTPADSEAGAHPIQSPLNLGIENSRRFRALPVYATLAAYGRIGYSDLIARQVRLARAIAAYITSSDKFELLPQGVGDNEIFMIVLFRARDSAVNDDLVRRVNGTRKIYISGTMWEGTPAARFAVATWMVDVERDMSVIRDVLEEAVNTARGTKARAMREVQSR